MDEYTACECAYKQGYEKGLRDAVKHGRWVAYESDQADTPCTEYRCSECGYDDGGLPEMNYCPNCGAKMNLNK